LEDTDELEEAAQEEVDKVNQIVLFHVSIFAIDIFLLCFNNRYCGRLLPDSLSRPPLLSLILFRFQNQRQQRKKKTIWKRCSPVCKL
jgi:hypothetical protein